MAVTINGSTGVQLDDNDKQKFGTGEDLEIYHDGSDSYIKHVGTDDLWIVGETDDVNIKAADNIILQPQNGENGVRILGDGAVELYYDNVLKLTTLSGGIQMANGSGNNSFSIYDSDKLTFGNAPDLEIYHDGSNSYIKDAGTGQLDISSDKVWISGSNDESMATFTEDGAVELYYNGTKKCQTLSTGFQIEGGASLHLVSGNWSGDAAGKIQNHANWLYFQCGANDTGWNFRLLDGTTAAHINSSGTYSSSDERLKKDITTITNAVDTIKQLTGRSFTWINGDKKSFGLIAQEVQSVLPDVVNAPTDPANKYPDNPLRSVNYAGLTGHFIEAIKELSTKIETLETEVNTLKTKVAALEAHTHE